MLKHDSRKNGFTLIEVMVVVAIMGILSAMGVYGVRISTINSQMKDCALNTAVFLERVANESNRMSKRLCVLKDNDQRLTAYVTDDCGDISDAEELVSFSIDPPAKFGCSGVSIDDSFNDFDGADWASDGENAGALFMPRIGLSAAPTEGYVCIQHGSSDSYGLAIKFKNRNMIVPMWRAGSYWNKL